MPVQKALDRLPTTKKKTVLIVEDNEKHARALADCFYRLGYQVFIENKLDKARVKLQVLDHTKTAVDIALVETKDPLSHKSAFLKHLHMKYKDVKTVLFTNQEDSDTKSAILNPGTPPQIVAAAVDNSRPYSQAEMKKHFELLRESDRIERDQAKLRSTLKAKTVITPEEIARYKEQKAAVVRRIAKLYLEVFQSPTRHYRKFMWKEFKFHTKLLNFEVTYGQMKMLGRHYRQYVQRMSKETLTSLMSDDIEVQKSLQYARSSI